MERPSLGSFEGPNIIKIRTKMMINPGIPIELSIIISSNEVLAFRWDSLSVVKRSELGTKILQIIDIPEVKEQLIFWQRPLF